MKRTLIVVATTFAAVLLNPAVSTAQDQDPPVDLIELVEHRPVVDITEMAPGDWFEWAVTVRNVTTGPLDVDMVFTAGETSALTTDPAVGLQAHLDTCPTPWTPVEGVGGAWSYTCGSEVAELAGPEPVADLLQEPHRFTMSGGTSMHVRATVTFPAEAGNDFENLADTLHIGFEAVLDADVGGGPGNRPVEPTTTTTITGGGGSDGGTGGAPTGGGDDGGISGGGGNNSGGGRGPVVPLPRTGVEIAGTVIAGLGLILAGTVLVRGTRREVTR